jgi:hypothetical protein
VNSILLNEQTTHLAAGFSEGASGTAILAVLMIGIGVKELRSDFPPVKDVHPLTLIVLGAGMMCFSGAMALSPGKAATLFTVFGAVFVVLAIFAQILFWTKKLPTVFWTPYQDAQKKLASGSTIRPKADRRE